MTPVHTTEQRPEQHGTGAADPRHRKQAEDGRDKRQPEADDGRAPNGQRPADARAVAREHRPEQPRADESADDDGADPGAPDRRLRRRIHDGPPWQRLRVSQTSSRVSAESVLQIVYSAHTTASPRVGTLRTLGFPVRSHK